MGKINRRQFVGSVLAGTGSVLTPSLAGEEFATPESPTARVPIGKSGVKASFVGIGTGVRAWMRESYHTKAGLKAFQQLVDHALEAGINFFDTADLYGTHTYVREALKNIPREKIVIQSKVWWRTDGLPEQVKDARQALDRFRKELGTDYLDHLLVHCTESPTWTTDLRPFVDYLDEAKQKGLIRAHGTSCHSLDALKTSDASPWVDVQLARINHKGVKMDGTPEQIGEVLRSMRSKGKGVIGMKIFGEGAFKTAEEREASLRFVIGNKLVDAMIIGFEQTEQIDDALKMIGRVLKT